MTTGDNNSRRSALFGFGSPSTTARDALLEALTSPTATVPFSAASAARLASQQMAASAAEWEGRIETWAADPSASEQDRIDRTLRMVNDAITDDAVLAALNPTVFLQGSYRNQTNVRLESDIDVCVLFTQTQYYRIAPGTHVSGGIGAATYTPQSLKAHLRTALENKFDAVTSGRKAFQIQPSTARVFADVVSAVIYRYYYTYNGLLVHAEGTAIVDGLEMRTNFPAAHFAKGNAKELATVGVYKKMVRFFKRLNLELAGAGYTPLPSFYVESLVWNCDPACFLQATNYAVATSVLQAIESASRHPLTCDWWEANGMKYLWNTACVHGGGQFASADALRFVTAAKTRLGIV